MTEEEKCSSRFVRAATKECNDTSFNCSINDLVDLSVLLTKQSSPIDSISPETAASTIGETSSIPEKSNGRRGLVQEMACLAGLRPNGMRAVRAAARPVEVLNAPPPLMSGASCHD
ncbi:acyl-CoA dehydrogenase [Striga asiatica]|uniref:Acyl-CoA dehydrogenase n=1 Tax=Striga asiatica TaxID=4170 RepID=A0A5A7QBN9_STRAF|nr:acyl-CoA dehydrogenase [Striga asiatica]